jgi:N-acyl-phosphatidylethanolamine-hydrolysing phospholipase D
VGMHWGTFDLSDEPLEAGPRRLAELIHEQALPPERFHVLVPGGTVALQGARGDTRAHTCHRFQLGEP